MLTAANHVGLYYEEIALTGEQIGNFPQSLHPPRAHRRRANSSTGTPAVTTRR
jgi:hypothetical protein